MCEHLDRCDSANGPENWPGSSASSHCDAVEQSPIDLCGATAPPHALPNLTFAAGYGDALTYKFSADGQAYLDAVGLGLTLDAGNLVRPLRTPFCAHSLEGTCSRERSQGRDSRV